MRIEVMTKDQVPACISGEPLVMVTWKAPEQFTPFVSQNWLAARTVLFEACGSSGGLSSLLTRSAQFARPAWKS